VKKEEAMLSRHDLSFQEVEDRDGFINRVLNDAIGAFSIFSIFIGGKLGFYRALADHGPLTAGELASYTSTQERYVREWLEHQAASCILEAHLDPSSERRFQLPPGRAEALVESDSLNYVAPMAQLVVGSVYPLESVLEAYRNGGGVPFSAYGPNLREGQASMNRPAFLQELGGTWLPTMADVHARLKADPPARIADIGCGGGWSCIGMARSYPKVQVHGYDLDEASVELARQNIQAEGLGDRVQVFLNDASDPELHEGYDLVTAFECVHDMSNPVGALRMMGKLAGEEGAVLIMDERSQEVFQSCAEAYEQLLYGFSILHCLPAGMSEQPSAGTGTVMRPNTVERYAREAGFSRVEILPIDHFFFRFYRLRR
jgi:2-polyprenyl-3-methyl-5-hydroxy-6-metoxy-1,4-benzoquinol methylase